LASNPRSASNDYERTDAEDGANPEWLIRRSPSPEGTPKTVAGDGPVFAPNENLEGAYSAKGITTWGDYVSL